MSTAVSSTPRVVAPRTRAIRPFYGAMSALIALAVVYGFAQTIDKNLLHPAVPRPLALYLHASCAFAWVAFFGVQTALVARRDVRQHRRLGWVGVGIGAATLIGGLVTTVVMGRFNVAQGRPAEQAAAFLAIPLNDMLAFGSALALAIVWRRRPAYHRRLMLLATCALTAAAFVRFPFVWAHVPLALRWYGGVDLLVALALVHDVVVERAIHPVHRVGVPLLLLGQSLAMAIFIQRPAAWIGWATTIVQ